MLFSLISLLSITTSCAQNQSDQEKVEAAVAKFVASADSQDVQAMTAVLDDHFRAVVNRQLGSDQMMVVNKTDYLSLLEAKKLGGDERDVKILALDINGSNAYVKAELNGMALKFTTYLLLASNGNGTWSVVQDMPTIEEK